MVKKNFKAIDLKTMFFDFRLKEKQKHETMPLQQLFQVMTEEEKVE